MKNLVLIAGFVLATISWWNHQSEVTVEETRIAGSLHNEEEFPIVCAGRVHGLTQSGEHVQSSRGPWIVRAEDTREISVTTSRVDPFVHGWIDRIRCRRMR